MTYSPFDLSGKVALVSGGSSGIGFGMAQALAQAGSDIAIWGRSQEKLDTAAEKLRAEGVSVFTCSVDVKEESQVVEGFAKTLEALGRIDTVIACAGISSHPTSYHEMTTEQFREVVGTNLEGTFFTFRAATAHMVERAGKGDEGGSLVAISSLSSRQGIPRHQHYSASKGGINAMIQGLATEYGSYGIRANTVIPGYIETDMTRGATQTEGFANMILPRTPSGRWGYGKDFGGIAVYLASDASSFHTGDTLTIDGGFWVC